MLTPRQAMAAISLVAAGALVAGCASQQTASSAKNLPKLHLAGSTAAVGTAAQPMDAAPSASGRLGIFGGYVLAGPLPAQPAEAAVWRWTAVATGAADGGKASRDEVAKVARLLGITATPQRHAYGWVASSATGELRVRDGAGNEWSYVRADLAPCPPYGIDVDNASGGGFGCASASAVGPAGTPVAPAPGPDDATTRAAAKSLLEGLPVHGSEHLGTGQVEQGPGYSTLTVSPTVGGFPTQGIETRVDVDGHGIRSATGRLGDLTAGPTYPLRTARAAFDELGNGPRPMIAQYCGPIPGPASAEVPEPSVPPVVSSPPAGVATPAPPAVSARPAGSPATEPTIAPGPVQCPTPQPVRVTGAVLGLQADWESSDDGPDILVPAWFFSTEGSTDPLPVIAVAPAFIAGPPNATTGVGATTGPDDSTSPGAATGSGGNPAGVQPPTSVSPLPPSVSSSPNG